MLHYGHSNFDAANDSIFASFRELTPPDSPSPDRTDITIDVHWEDTRNGDSRSEVGIEWHITEDISPVRSMWMQRADATGRLTRSPNGKIQADWTAHIDHPAQLHSAVKMTLAYALSFDGNFLLHASGVLRRGKLWLFAGPSGSGKSTIAEQLNAGGSLFCTDQAVLSVSEGIVEAYATPLSDFDARSRIRDRYPVEALIFIRQSQTHSLRRLFEHELGVRLLRNILFIPGADDRTRILLDSVSRIASSVPGYALEFKKDCEFWPLLDQCRI